ncbi:Cupin [Paenibacillus konkukensis]|uniref:Cupin n=1 Tax=Paenibacillus konkukensis TaxID=2020716 RepID=A0ABY4RFF5_9BACL|nr:cupin domain-containing protein [Paenibacillus konkukensis]UQZ81291.1 Cupin [Paenibacillus konkukensis]
MATLYMDYTKPGVQYFFDVNKNRITTRNADNFINRLGRDNLNTLGNVSLLDIYLSKGRVVEPHYHQNAAELVYCIGGAATVSLINPFNNQISNIPITPGQVANVPQGWWHWEIATEDKTHLLAIFDAPYPEYIFGSDILTKTPIEVLAHTYCLDPELLKKTLEPLHNETIVIGPTDQCVAQKQKSSKPQAGTSAANANNQPNAMRNYRYQPQPTYYGGGWYR